VGETAMEARFVAALVICRVADAENFPEVALTMTVPAPTAVTLPAATLATLESDVFHCAEAVRSLLLPSLYLPVAVNCWIAPGATLALPGVTCNEVRVGVTGGGGLLLLLEPPPEPQAASARLNEMMARIAVSFFMVFFLTELVTASYLGISHFQPSRRYVGHAIDD
jgi:hypothetical protein